MRPHANINTQVDRSKETFEWGRPDLDLLRQMCWVRHTTHPQGCHGGVSPRNRET